jgi:hypothetical protein
VMMADRRQWLADYWARMLQRPLSSRSLFTFICTSLWFVYFPPRGWQASHDNSLLRVTWDVRLCFPVRTYSRPHQLQTAPPVMSKK